jgi:hypothetical protein
VKEDLHTFRNRNDDYSSRKYWERGMTYGRILEDKRDEWQNKQKD